MKEFNFSRIFIIGICLVGYGTTAIGNDVPTFIVVSPRTDLKAPSIEVVFPNGFHDELVLTEYKLFKASKGIHNYIGYLKNTPESSVAVTGSLNGPDDRIEITLLSEHNTDEMFEVDYFGKTTILSIPLEIRSKGELINRKKSIKTEGAEEVKLKKEEKIDERQYVDIPSKVKVVVKIGRTEGFLQQLRVRNYPPFEEHIEMVVAHAQARYYHPSLGTKIQIEVVKGYLYDPTTSWCAEDGLSSACNAAKNANLSADVDVTSWFGDSDREECDDNVAGRSTGYLCNSNACNIVELVGNQATSGLIWAHELAHNLGIGHDDWDSNGGDSINNPCTRFEDWDGSVGWSSCNKYDFERAYAKGFWGQGCLEDISRPCTKYTCENGGTCTETENGGFECSCPSPVTGKRCENNPDPICKGGDKCCTKENKCNEWEGSCDNDDGCLNGLICGKKNCPRKYGYDWDVNDNCCFEPDLETTTTCKSMEIDGKGESGTCVFPFYLNGIKYNYCANADDEHDGGRWCPFNRTHNKMGGWGYCTNDCPSGTCEARSLECTVIKKGSKAMGTGYDGTCVFPFKYGGRIHYECADRIDYTGRGWCAFDSEFKSYRWGYCTSECPKSYDDPCEGIVCNVPNETCVDGVCKCGNACSCNTGSITGSYCDSENGKCKCSATEDVCEGNLKCDTSDGKCRRCIGDDDCCTNDNKCDIGEGDCESDSDCKEGLKCGNARKFCGKCKEAVGSSKNWGKAWELVISGKCGFWGMEDDCCYNPADVICTGGDSCCTEEYPCGAGEGDCDNDSHCEKGLKCGSNNCKPCPEGIDCSEFETDDDCCVEAD